MGLTCTIFYDIIVNIRISLTAGAETTRAKCARVVLYDKKTVCYNQLMAKTPFELTPQTLIKRVMSGQKEYRTNEYLTAFSKISSTDLKHSDYSRFEIIKLWNSLQTTPDKTCYFTFALHHDNHHTIKLLTERFAHARYAYICHDKDGASDRKHYHYVLLLDSPRSFPSIANDLELPVTMIEKVYSKKGILDYLTHENDPNKHHYSTEEITANFDVDAEKKASSGSLSKEEIFEEFNDLLKLKTGAMTPEEWLDKYWQKLCIVRHFASRYKILDNVTNQILSSSGMGLSSRTDCPIPYPRSKKAYQAGFSQVFPEHTQWLDKGVPVTFPPDHPAPAKKKTDYRKPNPRSDLADDVAKK